MAPDRLDVASGRGTGQSGGRSQLVDVLDSGPDKVDEGGKGDPGRRGDALGLAEQSHQMVGGNHCGGVIGGPVGVGHLQGPPAEVGDHLPD